MYRQRVERRPAASAVRCGRGNDQSPDQSSGRHASPPAAQFVAGDAIVQLEPRTMFAVAMSFEGLVNASKFPGNQSETAVAINHANQNNIFISANYGAFQEPDQGPNDPIAETGIFTSFSLDGGVTWTPRVIATDNLAPIGVSDDGFPIACCDPSAAFDDFGNLYFVYLGMEPLTQQTSVVVLVSSDGGQTFAEKARFFGDVPSTPIGVDRCEVTTAGLADGTSAVWVSFVDFGTTDPVTGLSATITAAGARVTGPGLPNVGDFGTPQKIPQGGPRTGAPDNRFHNLAHVNIGPDGQVSVTHQEVGQNPTDRIYVNTDPDGLGPAPFGDAVFVDQSQLTFFEPLPGQPVRGVAAVPTLAYDKSSGPHRGRLYIAYAQAVTEQRVDSFGFPIGTTTDSNVLVRWSDNNGASWSEAIRANDDPVTEPNSQFFQRIAVDPITGNVAVGWLDSRDDAGGGDSNDEISYYATVGQAAGNGIIFTPNMRLNVGLSNARFSGNFGNDYGDYTALDFYNNVLFASYPDNSNSTGDNPSGRLRAFDIYSAKVRVTDVTVPTPPFVTPASPMGPTVKNPQTLVKKGKFYQLKMSYNHPSGVNLATVGNDDLLVTGPNGFSQPMQLIKAKAQKKGTVVAATYRLAAPGGTWDVADNGVYTVTLQAGAVSSTDGTTTTTAGTVTRFNVNANPPKAGRSRREPASAAVVPVAATTSVFSNSSILSARDEDQSLRLLA
jgi:hypothetical protein